MSAPPSTCCDSNIKDILVCGGCGYIGSHVVLSILERTATTNYRVIIFDNLSTGHEASYQALLSLVNKEDTDNNDKANSDRIVLENGDVCNVNDLERVFIKYPKIDAVIHLCALIVVPESVIDPLKYYDNNVVGTLRLLQTMEKFNVQKFIFSSTAAIFGIPEFVNNKDDDVNNNGSSSLVIPSDSSTKPINPYGETKLCVEKMLHWLSEAKAGKFNFVSLRYFNACGAHESGKIGEDHVPESHLIPLILQVAQSKREKILVYGNDYENSKDGTCIRDYIHVMDLAQAHVDALLYLNQGGKSDCFNLGSGSGYSVLEVIEACRKVTNHSIPMEIAPRRLGDPAVLVACSKKAEQVLGWKRKYQDIETIVRTAWNWHLTHPNGYSTNNKQE
ncbi:hypothetical protein ABK040_001054 [Willaertia magna]